jgi:hypothetical protein
MYLDSIKSVSLWFVQNLLAGSAILFGGGVLIVTLFTYWQDFSALTNRK